MDPLQGESVEIYTMAFTPKSHRLKENGGAASVELSSDDLRRIAEVLAKVPILVERYPAHLAARVGK